MRVRAVMRTKKMLFEERLDVKIDLRSSREHAALITGLSSDN